MELKLFENLYAIEKGSGFQICIGMPDQSKNYLHCEVINNLWELEKFINDLNEVIINSDLELIKDEEYYRIRIVILVDDGDRALHFHSRKLNLNDALAEKHMIAV